MFSCTRIVSAPRHERPSTLSCFEYNVGVRILYKSFGFPLPLGGSSGGGLARLERKPRTINVATREEQWALTRPCPAVPLRALLRRTRRDFWEASSASTRKTFKRFRRPV